MHFSFFELDVFSESISLLQDTDTLGAIADWMTSNLCRLSYTISSTHHYIALDVFCHVCILLTS